MSISSSVRKAGPFLGNGVQTVFPFAFKVFGNADVAVYRAVGATQTTLTEGVDYSVGLNTDQENAPGGVVALTIALAVSSVLVITSDVEPLQPVVVTNAGGFFPAVFNGVFDRLTILIQQILERLTRTLSLPATTTVTDMTIPVLAGAVLQWNPGATQLVAQTLPDLSLSLALPAQGGQAGKYLQTNGTIPSWQAVPAATVASVAGLTGAITGAALKAALAIAVADIVDYTSATTTIADARATTIANAVFGTYARSRLVADTTYYVRTDGNDANTGLVDNAGGAFLTIQKALDMAAMLDLNGYTLTIQVRTGTYAGTLVIPALTGQRDETALIIQGDLATPTNVQLTYSGAGGTTVLVPRGARATLQGFRIAGAAGGIGVGTTLLGVDGGKLSFKNITFGAAFVHLGVSTQGFAECTGPYTIAAGAGIHVNADYGGYFRCVGRTVTLTGTPAWTASFVYAQRTGVAQFSTSVFSGAATGVRYDVRLNGVVETTGGGATFLPGNAAGSTATGGQYS